MLDFIRGLVIELTPTTLVLETNGLGYDLNISIQSFTKLQNQTACQIFVHEVIREDAHHLFGFVTRDEREVFRLLISVSGVGANTARMILSSMSTDEVRSAIATGNVESLKSIKGIGAKSAQRIIVDLKDKIDKSSDISQLFKQPDNTIKKEALSALEILGFSRKNGEKVVDKLLADESSLPVEEVIKQALKLL
ncbi:MAG: Holliday junction branch migration protein RuvA [Bacteroidales bacterium]|nr:Holliday junction branch migration protein RuvA [Bacteroidales bacterium]